MKNEEIVAPELDPETDVLHCTRQQLRMGRVESEAGAIELMRQGGGRNVTEFVVFRCAPGTYVNEMGGFNRPMVDPRSVKVRHQHPRQKRKS
jgi:hypothetical protein